MYVFRECFKRLKKFLTPPNEVVVMLSSLRSVYGDYLAAPVLPFKMKSVSCEGTLNGCITEVGRLTIDGGGY